MNSSQDVTILGFIKFCINFDPVSMEISDEDKEKYLRFMVERKMVFGHNKSVRNSGFGKMSCVGTKFDLDIIDPVKIILSVKKTYLDIISNLSSSSSVLFLGISKFLKEDIFKRYISEMEKHIRLFWVYRRWLGGTFTNVNTILKNIDIVEDIKSQIKSLSESKIRGKHKQIKGLNITYNRSFRHVEGIYTMRKLPNMLVVLSVKQSIVALREAKLKNIFTVGIADTDADLNLVDSAVFCNDESVYCFEVFVNLVIHAFKNLVVVSRQQSSISV